VVRFALHALPSRRHLGDDEDVLSGEDECDEGGERNEFLLLASLRRAGFPTTTATTKLA